MRCTGIARSISDLRGMRNPPEQLVHRF